MTLDPSTLELLGAPAEGVWAASSVHATLLDFWESHASEAGWVPKSAVDPLALKRVLPSLMLLKKSGLRDWQFTVVGTGVVAGYGEDFSGTLLSDLVHSPCRNVYEEMIGACLSSVGPQVCIGRMRYPRREFLNSIKTVFPVSANATDVTHCLFGLSVESRPKSMSTIYDPVAPLEAFDRLYRIGERDIERGSDTWAVSSVGEIQTKL